MGHDDTTDKLFPPPEARSGVQAPIPLQPSIRAEFMAHRVHLDAEASAIRREVAAALHRLAAPPEVTAAGAVEKVKAGALAGLKFGGVALALGEATAALAGAMGHPEVEGPIRTLLTLLGGS